MEECRGALGPGPGKLIYRDLRARCDRVRDMRLARAREACRLAGLDPSIIGIHVHNALVSLEYGKPWPEVNYHYARKARWLMEGMFKASDCLDRLYRRKGPYGFDWS